MKHKAFTLTELLIGVTLIVITSGVFYLNLDKVRGNIAKYEADRVAAYIYSHMRRADMTHDALWIAVTTDSIVLKIGGFADRNDYDNAQAVDEGFNMSTGCSFQNSYNLVYPKDEEQAIYDLTFQPVPSGAAVKVSTGTGGKYCITVNGSDGKQCNILIGDQT